MNLGTVALRTVSLNHPKIDRAPSKASIAASDDYFSFSDYASDISSFNDRAAASPRWKTPPSRTRTQPTSREHLQSETTLPTTKEVKPQQPAPTPPAAVRFSVAKDMDRGQSGGPSRHVVSRSVSRAGAITPGVDDTPFIRFAIDQLTRDKEVAALQRSQTASSESTYPVDRIVGDEGLGYYEHADERDVDEKPLRESSLISEAPELSRRDVYIPVKRPGDSYRHPKLNFVPGILRPLQLFGVLVISLLALAGSIFSLVYSRNHNGLWNYQDSRGERYYVFEFLPPLIATFIVFLILSIMPAIYRMMPFISMASDNSINRSNAALLALAPTDFLLPDVQHLRYGNTLIGVCMLIFWLALFTVPLAASLFQPRFESGTWRWLTVQPVAYVLIALYSLLCVAILTLLVYFIGKNTGLKCDPRSLADLIVLLQRSNSLEAYAGTETLLRKSEFRHALLNRSNRLGYWTTTSRPHEVFYAIGEEGASTRRYTIMRGRVAQKPAFDPLFAEPDADLEKGYETDDNISSQSIRYRYIPWFLRDTFVVLWAVLAVVLFTAFLIAGNLHHTLLNGFRPLLPTAPDSNGFSSSNFLYSFLPTFLALLLTLFAYNIDFTLRALQPFANLASTSGGADAEHSLLLDYPAALPFKCTYSASINGDLKIALFSMLSLLSLALPVLAGGLLLAQNRPSSDPNAVDEFQIVIVAHPGAFYTLIGFLAVYVLAICLIWPGRKRALPHGITTLAEVASFLYKSPVVHDAAFREVSGRRDLVTRLVTPPRGEIMIPGGRGRWGFGVFVLAGGQGQGLGIERVGRRDGGGVRGMGASNSYRIRGKKEGKRFTGDGREIRRVTSVR